MKMRRRMLLKGAGGVCLTLPFLEGLAPKHAAAAGDGVEPFAIFFRQANGVGAAQNTELGSEPERFWPQQLGELTPQNVQGRAVDELSDHLERLLVVRNVNMENFNYGDGHARGAMQGLTARGPTVQGAGGSSEAAGESIDHYIGRNLNPDNRDSLFLYAGRNNGWLGGACISYRGSGQRRAPLHNPVTAYMTMMGVDSSQFEMLAARQKSINDLVREQMSSLMASPQLSAVDRQRLDLHMQSIRDLEDTLMCHLSDDEEATLDGVGPAFDSDNGNLVLSATRVHMDIAALAVACGYTRSVAIQVGNGNDGSTRYENLDTGNLMENFHFISHRRMSHDSNGSIIAGSDLLHHMVDRHFARTFNHLLNKLHDYVMPTGQRLIDCGVAVWYNDNGNGPGHSANNIPYVLAGGANGFLRTGQYIEASGGNQRNHRRMLNTIATAAGVRAPNGDYINDFGDPGLPGGILEEMLA